MSIELIEIVSDFARCIEIVDAKRPQAVNVRSKMPYQPGIGPHAERRTVEMVTAEMVVCFPAKYGERVSTNVPYPDVPRQRCDFCIGASDEWEWAVEVKMLRILGDNGKPNDNILMHILSPYPDHRSAVTDCEKLASSPIGKRKAVLIYGYEAEEYPLSLAIDAFETIAAKLARLSPRASAGFSNLVHPIHSSGRVYGWQVT
jgi:hypothetical protein